jgi:DNA-binding PadR family transcriptional regulator
LRAAAQEFEERTNEVWPLNVGQVYTTLQRLERDGLIESDNDEEAGPQKSFRITAEWAAELDTWCGSRHERSFGRMVIQLAQAKDTHR